MDKGAFSNDAVVTAMQDMLVISIDAESEIGVPLAKRFAVKGYPTLLFLNSDGSPRDSIPGFMEPDAFRTEVDRIVRGTGTVSDLHRRLNDKPDDLELRFQLAKKLEGFGDETGFEKQIEEIMHRDPDGRHAVTRRVKFQRTRTKVLNVSRGQIPDPMPLVKLLADETDSELLFEGHGMIARIYQARATKEGEGEGAADAHRRAMHSNRLAWKHCPDDQRAGFGNQLAWGLWERRESINQETRAFALEVARVAAKHSGDDPNVLDTLACCHYMNGQAKDAIRIINRCIELQPEQEAWQERLELFSQQS